MPNHAGHAIRDRENGFFSMFRSQRRAELMELTRSERWRWGKRPASDAGSVQGFPHFLSAGIVDGSDQAFFPIGHGVWRAATQYGFMFGHLSWGRGTGEEFTAHGMDFAQRPLSHDGKGQPASRLDQPPKMPDGFGQLRHPMEGGVGNDPVCGGIELIRSAAEEAEGRRGTEVGSGDIEHFFCWIGRQNGAIWPAGEKHARQNAGPASDFHDGPRSLPGEDTCHELCGQPGLDIGMGVVCLCGSGKAPDSGRFGTRVSHCF